MKEPRLASSVEEAAAAAVDVILKDGGTLRLRPPAAADADAVLEFLQVLSERSLYLRFHGIRTVDEALAGSLLDPDWVEHAFVRIEELAYGGDAAALAATVVELSVERALTVQGG